MESVELEILSYIKLDPNKDGETFEEFGMEAFSEGERTTFIYRVLENSQDVMLSNFLYPEEKWIDAFFPLDADQLLIAAKEYMTQRDIGPAQ